MLGGDGDDRFAGGGGPDTLLGGRGDDTISGGSNNDQITGGAGDDILSGNAGADTFNFAGSFGHDTIKDFAGGSASGHDVIHFTSDDFTSFGAIQQHMVEANGDVVITLPAGDSIVLLHQTLANMVSDDFTFG